MDLDEVRISWCDSLARQDPDLLIGAVGYEARSRHAFLNGTSARCRRLGISYEAWGEGSFDQNHRLLTDAGVEIKVPGGERDSVRELVSEAIGALGGEPSLVVLDVSSFDRGRMAEVIVSAIAAVVPGSIVRLCYSPSTYVPPPTEFEPIESFAPVARELAGWTRHPEWPCDLLIGLGYERERAMGVLELVEAGMTWAFVAHSKEARFAEDTIRANRLFLDVLGPHQVVPYQLEDPVAAVNSIESLVRASLVGGRPLLVPLGPKLFAALSIVVALRWFPEISVWRMSAGVHHTPVDCAAAGPVIACDFRVDADWEV